MDLKDMIFVTENYKGTEKNMLMTLEDYKKFVSIEDMSELAEHMLLLGRTLAQGEGFAEHYRAANVTVFAKFCNILAGSVQAPHHHYRTLQIL